MHIRRLDKSSNWKLDKYWPSNRDRRNQLFSAFFPLSSINKNMEAGSGTGSWQGCKIWKRRGYFPLCTLKHANTTWTLAANSLSLQPSPFFFIFIFIYSPFPVSILAMWLRYVQKFKFCPNWQLSGHLVNKWWIHILFSSATEYDYEHSRIRKASHRLNACTDVFRRELTKKAC